MKHISTPSDPTHEHRVQDLEEAIHLETHALERRAQIPTLMASLRCTRRIHWHAALRVRDGESLTTEVMLSVSINSELYDDAPIVHRHDSICITSTSVKEERPDPAHLT